MRNIFVLVILMAYGEIAFSACTVKDELVQGYGISPLGFKKDMPKSKEPTRDARAGEEWVSVGLNDPAILVNDGFSHSALINRHLKQAWILRSGGIAGAREWYGPVPLKNIDVTGCDASKPDLTIYSTPMPKGDG
jgi:hypothetical protein